MGGLQPSTGLWVIFRSVRGVRHLLVPGSFLLVWCCDIFGHVGMKAGGPAANETVRQWE